MADQCLESGDQRTLVRRPIDANDPTETLAASDFRTAKALFVPSLTRDIVPSVCMDMTPTGGSHDSLHSTARIHIRTGQRGGCVAGGGASATASDASDRVHQRPLGR